MLDILEFGELKNARVVAGTGGLNRQLHSVSILEVMEAKVADWMLDGQLYVSSLYSICNDIDQQLAIIRTLHRAKSCGFVICHVNSWVKNISSELIELCDELNFPLIIAPNNSSYIEIITPIIEILTHHQDKKLISHGSLEYLVRLISGESRLDMILKKIAHLFDDNILFFDMEYQCIYAGNNLKGRVSTILSQHINQNYYKIYEEYQKNSKAVLKVEETLWFIYPIQPTNAFYGFIVLNAELVHKPQVLDILNNVMQLFSILFTQQQRIDELKEIYIHNYVDDLLSRRFPNINTAIKNGLSLGIDISNKNFLLVAAYEQQKNHAENSLDGIQIKLKQTIQLSDQSFVILPCSEGFLLLIQDGNDNPSLLMKIAKIVQKSLQTLVKQDITIAVSGLINEEKCLVSAYYEAIEAIKISRQFDNTNEIIKCDTLGFLPLLYTKKFSKKLIPISHNLINPLKQYDEQHNTHLCKTFFCILQEGMNMKKVANQLFLHKNTVQYRKNKIKEILGVDPFVMPHIVNYQVAYLLLNNKKNSVLN